MKKNLKEFKLSEKEAEKYYNNLEDAAKKELNDKIFDAGYQSIDFKDGFGKLLTRIHEEKPELFIELLGKLVPTEELKEGDLEEGIDLGAIAMLFTMGAAAGLPTVFKVMKEKMKDKKKAEDLGRLLYKIDDKYPGGIAGLKKKMEAKFDDWRETSNAFLGIADELDEYLNRREIDDLRFINNFFHKELSDNSAKARTGGSRDISFKKIKDTYKKYANKYKLKPITEGEQMSTFKKALEESLEENSKKVSEKNIDKLTNKDIKAALKQASIQSEYEEFRQGLIKIVKNVDPDALGDFLALDKKASNAIDKLTEFVSKL